MDARELKTTIRLSEEEGALLIGEIDYTREQSRLLPGAWGYTASIGDFNNRLLAKSLFGREAPYVLRK